jgi:hypothetical protein
MAKLNSKKQKKIIILRRKKFGRIDYRSIVILCSRREVLLTAVGRLAQLAASFLTLPSSLRSIWAAASLLASFFVSPDPTATKSKTFT